MKSELWQRLRAARQAAGLRQLDVARKLGITRPAYAFMEWRTPEGRVTPSVVQIQIIADTLGVPVSVLMSDDTDPTDLLLRRTPDSSGPAKGAPVGGSGGRMLELFWRAVEFAALTRRPELSGCFDVQVGPHKADFVHGKTLIEFKSAGLDVKETVAKMALLDLAGRKRHDKHLVVWCPEGPDTQLRDALSSAERDYGVTTHVVTDGDQATQLVLHLA